MKLGLWKTRLLIRPEIKKSWFGIWRLGLKLFLCSGWCSVAAGAAATLARLTPPAPVSSPSSTPDKTTCPLDLSWSWISSEELRLLHTVLSPTSSGDNNIFLTMYRRNQKKVSITIYCYEKDSPCSYNKLLNNCDVTFLSNFIIDNMITIF